MDGVPGLHGPAIRARSVVPPAAIHSDIRIKFVRFPRVAGNITAQ
jgi:hypothetical protein